MKVTDNAELILKERYYQSGEDWEKLCRRVAKFIDVDNGKYENDFFNMLYNTYFLPNSPTLMNAGTKIKNLSACFVLPIPDNIEGIYETLKHAAKIHASGGGTGFDFSDLRPNGAEIKSTNGTTSGPISFLQVFDSSTNIIKQGGRRKGANMAVMRIDHPDIEEFISCKHEEGKISNFNISVALTDKFIQACIENDDFYLDYNHHNLSVKKVKASELLNKILQGMWKNGEPGILFIDTVNNHKNGIQEWIASTNPCQPGWAKILTSKGIKELKDISIGDIIWSKDGWTEVINKTNSGIKKVYKYSTTQNVFYGTENHKIIENGKKVEVKNAKAIDVLKGNLFETFNPVNINIQDVMDGLVIGDGTVHKASNNKVGLIIGDNDQDYFKSEISSLIVKERPGIKPKFYEIKTTICASELPKIHERLIPNRFINDLNKSVGFLRGLYSANGSVVRDRVSLKATSKGLLEQVQLVLSSLGIKSYITTNKPSLIKWPNGEYKSRISYDLNICTDKDIFYKCIGFIQSYKNEKLAKIIKKGKINKNNTAEIKSIEYVSTEEVYDITVDNTSHTYWTQGCNVSNCGEIPLPAYGSCNLGSIDLSKLINEEGKIDFCRLDDTICLAIRFLDNVITKNEYIVDKIKEKALLYRPIGLGIMGWADLLIKLKIEYGSEESIELASTIMSFISQSAKIWSKALLDERGPNGEDNKNRRNATVTSIAPTGTLSTIANCSSGIEPNFAWEYTANRIDKELQYFHPLAAEYLQNNKRLPDYFVTSQEIEPIKHVKMQASFQDFVDNSISKTINLPYKTTVEEIRDIIFEAWRSGCKGLTVYRDGSRQKQVLIKKEKLITECPLCGAKLNHSGGCLECVCGWTACSL